MEDINYGNVEETQDADALEIIKSIQNGEDDFEEDESDNEEENDSDTDDSSSEDEDDNKKESDDKSSDDKKLFANKYKSVDELKKGIKNIGSTLPDYVLNNLSDKGLEEHYLELQKDFSSRDRRFSKDNKEDIAEPKENEENDKESSKEEKLDANATIAEAEALFNSTGSLTNEMYDKLEKAGVPSSIVDRHIEMVQREAVEFTKNVYELSGGEEKYNEIKAWAENGGIAEAELNYVNSMTDKNALLGVLQSIKARYDLANPSNKRIVGEQSNTGKSVYKDINEYMEDVNNPKYSHDENFRERIDKKLARSKLKI